MFDKFIITHDENGNFTSSAHPDGWSEMFSGSFADRAAKLKEQLLGYYPTASVDIVATGSSDFIVACQVDGQVNSIWNRQEQSKFDTDEYIAQGLSTNRVIYQTIHNGTLAKSCKGWVDIATGSAE
tara:strand:+ start:475 stop:852 length:378 start_codon:yes stop_codon:yes gene_type:complete